jgi:hypothetical protein
MLPLFDKEVVSSAITDLQRKLHGSGLHTKAGHRIQGRFKRELTLGTHGKILLLEHVKITDISGKLIYEEHQKIYPLILASRIESVFGGAADRKQFVLKNQARTQRVTSHKSNLTPTNVGLNELYQRVRDFRELAQTNPSALEPVVLELNRTHTDDWLLRLELLEIFEKQSPNSIWAAQLREHLKNLSESHSEWKDLIARGLALINS